MTTEPDIVSIGDGVANDNASVVGHVNPRGGALDRGECSFSLPSICDTILYSSEGNRRFKLFITIRM